jgi:hypothetical protein
VSFSDDDLKRLKEADIANQRRIDATGGEGAIVLTRIQFEALLARLEAGDRCFNYLRAFDLGELPEGDKVQWTFPKEFYIALRDALEAWRKACGK